MDMQKNIKNISLVISMSEGENESTAVSSYVLPINSMFESWEISRREVLLSAFSSR
ncbi:MAG: hypothetical protein R3A12_00295 [Ignavibacteria bacterium]